MSDKPIAEIVPALRYRDAPAAIAFLRDVFGLEPTLVVPGEGNVVQHAQLTWGNGCVMLGSLIEGDDDGDRVEMTVRGSCLYLILDDVDAHYARTVAAGAEITRELRDEDYGGRGYVARDPRATSGASGRTAPSDVARVTLPE
ncbi:VOC family protein [Yinghuangia sp. YIM S09857]|uniref:VOC family protein n=1 Tax=Yinghuangia sp. YIM S09857 TaxID=3436929 RepID=UPI003F52E8C4